MKRCTFLLFFTCLFPAVSHANPIRGTLPGEGIQQIFGIPTSSSLSNKASSKSNFRLKVKGSRARFGLLDSSNAYLPILLGIKKGKRTFTVKQAIDRGLCGDSDVAALTVSRRRIRRARFAAERIGEANAYARLSGAGGRGSLRSKIRRFAERASTVSVNSDCSPEGNATNLGINTSSESSAENIDIVLRRTQSEGDVDSDGLPDLLDSDVDGDSIINNYDSDFSIADGTFYVFSNLKTGIENTVNSNTGKTPTDEEIDSLLQNTTQLAIEVKGDPDDGDVSELDCGVLGYCSAGGTGTIANSSDAFPGAAGGSSDTDSDGLGEMTAGSTGDFQLKTGAAAADINAGDSFVQVVTNAEGKVTKFFQKLNFVFKGTPAITEIETNPDTASRAMTTFSYPLADGAAGTPGNCILLDPDSGNITFEITAYRPQRKGISALGEGDFVDIGGSEVTIDIPNAPCASPPCSETRMPNNCRVSAYTESDDDLEISDGKLIDTKADADADPANTITFRVDVVDCLAETGDTFDAGEQLNLGIQFRSLSEMDGSDNAAVNFCFRRS